jgi:tripartite-type tricarboxylate transporter receptor subunit TctC
VNTTVKPILRRLHHAAALALCLALGTPPVRAEFPVRPITLIVPFAAGGANDSVARLLAGRLGPILGQTVIVENRPGGGTVVGTAAVARARPDGYTILLVSAAHTINPHILRDIPYDALRDFTPISQLTRTAYILVTSQASNFGGIEDMVTTGAAPDGRITFASSGTGSVPHLAGLLLSTLSNVRAIHIPYQGGAPALLGILRGDVDIYFSSIVGARPFIESKRMRALAVSSDKRLAMLADIPTMSEQGVRGFAIDGWYGAVGPANLPAAVTATLHAGIVRALAEPDLAGRLKSEGEEIVGSSPEAFAALLRGELAKYEAIVATAGAEATLMAMPSHSQTPNVSAVSAHPD